LGVHWFHALNTTSFPGSAENTRTRTIRQRSHMSEKLPSHGFQMARGRDWRTKKMSDSG
jgi:hypothetical protein